jgi:hypothetical protein
VSPATSWRSFSARWLEQGARPAPRTLNRIRSDHR